MSERYLWYKDIPKVNEKDSRYNVLSNGVLDVWSSVLNYFTDSITPLKTANGTLVDKFSFIIDSDSWNNFVGSNLRGYGFMLRSSTQGNQRVLSVAYVFPNTPAKNAGLAREIKLSELTALPSTTLKVKLPTSLMRVCVQPK